MSNVSLSIGGRNFTVACASGEEEHVAALGQMIDSKVAGMGDTATHSEGRMLLFGALLLADELYEARQGRSQGATQAAAPPSQMLDAIAQRLENLAGRLEDLGDNP